MRYSLSARMNSSSVGGLGSDLEIEVDPLCRKCFGTLIWIPAGCLPVVLHKRASAPSTKLEHGSTRVHLRRKTMSPINVNKTCCVFLPPGYDGANCEIDVDECAEQPCENGGECFERSDPSHWELDWEISFADAAGYICQCQPGFAGKTN